MHHDRFPLPQGGAALPLTFHPSTLRGPTHSPSSVLIIGTDKLAASRAYTFLDSGAKVVVGGRQRGEGCEEVEWRLKGEQVGWVGLPEEAGTLEEWVEILESIPNLMLCTVTDTIQIPSSSPNPHPARSYASASIIFTACTNLRIPINVTDTPSLCTFTFPSTHRFLSTPIPRPSPSYPYSLSSSFSFSSSISPESDIRNLSNLQISISTNGQGCRLASRIKREIVGKLSRDVGGAVDNVGILRDRVRAMGVSLGMGDHVEGQSPEDGVERMDGDEVDDGRRRGRERDLTPRSTGGSFVSSSTTIEPPRRTSACRKLQTDDAEPEADRAHQSSRARSRTRTRLPPPALALLPPATLTTGTDETTSPTDHHHPQQHPQPPATPTDDDDTSLFSSGPLNSPVPQLHAQQARSAPGSRPGTPVGAAGRRMERGDSGYFVSGYGVGGGVEGGAVGQHTAGGGATGGTHRQAISRASSARVDGGIETIASSSTTTSDSEPEIDPSQEDESSVQATSSPEEETLRRLRWVSQISEYWSIDYLARMSREEMDKVLIMWKDGQVGLAGPKGSVGVSSGDGAVTGGRGTGGIAGGIAGSFGNPGGPGGPTSNGTGGGPSIGPPIAPRHEIALTYPQQPPPALKRGKILLVGSGPGHPDLLTVAARKALETATLILSDKLVPAEVLALVPSTTELHIAKKFPGNAEGAQNEMMDLALEGARRGETVVRLKQGDPFVYGRGGEEVLFFRENGFESVVIPGVSSALAGPLMMNVPVTQRGVAESMVLCTGVGRKGKAVQLPGYVRSRSLVVLMGVARIKQVLQVLLRPGPHAIEDIETQGWRDGAAFPPYLPIAIIERASSHDQRMVASTLENIEDALERSGEQRPPGMMIIGWAVLALEGKGDVQVLDDDERSPDAEARDRQRVATWLDGREYVLKDGLLPEWRSIAEASINLA